MRVKIFFADTFKDSAAALMKSLAEDEKEDIFARRFVLTPDKLTLAAESEILAAGRGATFNTAVYSFSRLYTLLAEKESAAPAYLDKLGAVQLIERIIAENKKELKCLKGFPGDAGEMYKIISKLKYCTLSPAALKAAAVKDGYLDAKVSDIAFIYERYEAAAAERFYDSAGKLKALCGILENKELLRNVRVYLKDYDNFSRQELDVIARLTAACECVSVSCTYEDAGRPHLYSNAVFNSVTALCEDAGIVPELIDCNTKADAVREQIKRGLFSFNKPEKLPAKDCRGRIFMTEAPDTVSECLSAAEFIDERVRSGARYKDFTLTAADIKSYAAPLSAAFSRFNIPLYLDENLPLAAHPLTRFILSLFDLKLRGKTRENIFAFVKNYFFCGGGYDADGFINAYLAGGRPPEGEVFSRLNAYLDAADFKDADKVEYYTAAVGKFLEFIGAADKLKTLAEREEASGRAAGAAFSLQALDKINEILEAAKTVLGGYFVTLAEFAALFSAAAAEEEIGAVAMNLDCVFAGELTTGKYHSVKNLLILGAADGVIPAEERDVEFLNESNLAELKTRGADITPTVAENNVKNRFNVFQLLIEPSDAVYLSFAVNAGGGGKRRESRVITEFKKLFGVEVTRRLSAAAPPPAPAPFAKEDLPDAGALFSPAFSASKIETFYQCPYRHFLRYGLKLRERDTPDLLPIDTGTILHAVAEGAVKAFCDKDFDAGAAQKLGIVLAETKLAEFPKLFADKRFAAVKRRILTEAAALAASIREGIERSEFKPVKDMAERAFEEGAFTGVVDRADRCGDFIRVIDYKTGGTDLNYKNIYTGKKLQLFIYLAAARRITGRRAAGAYYFPVGNDYTELKKGVKGRLFGYGLKEIKAYSEAGEIYGKECSEEDLEELLTYAADMKDAAAAEIKNGFIAASPYDGACSYCEFTPLCAGREKRVRAEAGRIYAFKDAYGAGGKGADGE